MVHRQTTAIGFGVLLLLASCSRGLAFVGETARDWSIVIPRTETRLGVIEWKTGSTTVFLGIVDFSVPCGAYAALGIAATGVVIIGALSLFYAKRRPYDSGP